MSKDRLLVLDSIRGVAAFFVILFHYNLIVFSLTGHKLDYLRLGNTGVDLFFIISGFVIFKTLSAKATPLDFVVSRFSRLYPVYWVCVFLTATGIFIYSHGTDPLLQPKVILANLTMLQDIILFPAVNNSLDLSYWTLYVELWFYFFMFILCLFKQLRNIEIIGALAMAACLIFTLVGERIPFYKHILGGIPLISFCPLFFAGIIFYKIKYEGSTTYRHVLIGFCLLLAFYMHDMANKSKFFITFVEHMYITIFYFTVFYLFIFNKLNFLDKKALVFLGTISYSLYLIHQRLGSLIIQTLYSLNVPLVLCIAAAVVFSITTASLLTFYVERPANRYLRDLYTQYKLNKKLVADN